MAPNLLSDPLFLRVNRRGLGIYRKPIEIDHTRYHVLDPSQRNKWRHGYREANVILFVVSLTSYYEFSDDQTV